MISIDIRNQEEVLVRPFRELEHQRFFALQLFIAESGTIGLSFEFIFDNHSRAINGHGPVTPSVFNGQTGVSHWIIGFYAIRSKINIFAIGSNI